MLLRPLPRRSRLVRSIAAGMVCAVTAAGLAGESAPQDQPRPSFRTEANYVRVDVYATTRDGATVGDLRREDFQLLEDRVPQTIDQFSPVVIRAGGALAPRADPRTLEDSRQAATDPRARVFVLFLDQLHVDGVASKTVARPLADALRRLIGPDDLVAIVSPRTPIRTMTFTRELATIERTLDREWGLRDSTDFLDTTESKYADCYPGMPVGQERVARDLGIAQEMILRRREEQTLETLEELVTYLRDVREERKAVITVSNGWRVYRANPAMERQPGVNAPTGPRVGVDPRTGTFSTDPAVAGGDRGSPCDGDRFRLAALDHTRRFRELLDRANRANVSFYPVDPRGVVVFDDDIRPVAGVGQNPSIRQSEDIRRRGERHDSLRTMAEATDGVAVIDTNDFAPALQRMTNDLSAYYLLGYYSTGKLDGRFHAITVRVTRPDVQIRARRGYLAATTVSGAAPAVPAADPRVMAETQAVTAALASLGTSAREPPMYLQTAAATSASGARAVWAVLEVPRAALAEWAKGGDVDALLIDESGNTAGAGRVAIAAGTAAARVTIAPRGLAPGTYDLRVRARSAGASTASNESVRLVVPDAPDGSGALFFRRGPATGNRETATADLRFRRSEALRVMVPASSSTTDAGARLLDRTGKTLGISVTPSIVDELDGSRWLTAQATLAPLGAGDYVIEVSGMAGGVERRALVAFRVVP